MIVTSIWSNPLDGRIPGRQQRFACYIVYHGLCFEQCMASHCPERSELLSPTCFGSRFMIAQVKQESPASFNAKKRSHFAHYPTLTAPTVSFVLEATVTFRQVSRARDIPANQTPRCTKHYHEHGTLRYDTMQRQIPVWSGVLNAYSAALAVLCKVWYRQSDDKRARVIDSFRDY